MHGSEGAASSAGESGAGVPFDALHHRARAIGALRRQMLADADVAEDPQGVDALDLLRGLAGKDRGDQGDDPPGYDGIAVAVKIQHRAVRGPRPRRVEPDLG